MHSVYCWSVNRVRSKTATGHNNDTSEAAGGTRGRRTLTGMIQRRSTPRTGPKQPQLTSVPPANYLATAATTLCDMDPMVWADGSQVKLDYLLKRDLFVAQMGDGKPIVQYLAPYYAAGPGVKKIIEAHEQQHVLNATPYSARLKQAVDAAASGWMFGIGGDKKISSQDFIAAFNANHGGLHFDRNFDERAAPSPRAGARRRTERSRSAHPAAHATGVVRVALAPPPVGRVAQTRVRRRPSELPVRRPSHRLCDRRQRWLRAYPARRIGTCASPARVHSARAPRVVRLRPKPRLRARSPSTRRVNRSATRRSSGRRSHHADLHVTSLTGVTRSPSHPRRCPTNVFAMPPTTVPAIRPLPANPKPALNVLDARRGALVAHDIRGSHWLAYPRSYRDM